MDTQTFSKAHRGIWQRYIPAGLILGLLVIVASCKKDEHNSTKKSDVIYLQSNDFHDNQNAVLAYYDRGNGALEALPGSPFYTGGSGVGNPEQILGPLDSDYELRLSTDGNYLLAVNSGSNTIAVFYIKPNGGLEPVAGSPFPSGGQTPVSIDVRGNHVFVVNKSQDPLHTTEQAPSYTTFTIDGSGKLTPVPWAAFETTRGVSPTQALVSNDGKFLFGDDFLGFMGKPATGTLRSFTIAGSGKILPVTGTPYFVPKNAEGMNGALGLWQHPKSNILYAGFPLLGQIGVYGIDATSGALSLQTTVTAGKAACWIRTNKSGTRMYVLNSGENSVQVFNTTAASAPASMQTLELKQSGPEYTVPGAGALKTSQPFSLVLSTSEKTLYVVNQHTNNDFSIGNYNYLHALQVGDDGLLTEAAEPLKLPVPNTVRPKGSAVVQVHNLAN